MFLGVVLLLLLPLIAMQFTNEVHWTALDFFAMALILSLCVLSIEFVCRRVKIKMHKMLYIICVFMLFLLLWIELAVGIF
jgi:hypothetical protein